MLPNEALRQTGVNRDETTSESEADAIGPSLFALLWMLRFHDVAIEPANLTHQLGSKPSVLAVARYLRQSGLRARVITVRPERLDKVSLPAVAVMANGEQVVVGRVADEGVMLLDPNTRRPLMQQLHDFLTDWTGVMILATRRSGLLGSEGRFDLRWFATAIRKYRGVLSEVLVASLFLQVFALATPFAFQILVDKVLVNRGMSTLDVLAIGLAAIAIFEAVLGGLRTFIFAHTTNRVDVELGAKLFHHLLSLPLTYFQARRVGDSVARVRELETIRQFLTSSALTMVMDLLFTVVFLGVMATYSLTLTCIVLASFPVFAAVSAIATPIFRARLDDRFKRGAENQAFLVEAVSGIETLKAMAVEPQMQQRWEEQLAGYVGACHGVSKVGNTATQLIQVTSKLTTAATLWFGAHAVINGSLSTGWTTRWASADSLPSTCSPNVSSSPCSGWLRCIRTFIRHACRSSVSVTSSTHRRS